MVFLLGGEPGPRSRPSKSPNCFNSSRSTSITGREVGLEEEMIVHQSCLTGFTTESAANFSLISCIRAVQDQDSHFPIHRGPRRASGRPFIHDLCLAPSRGSARFLAILFSYITYGRKSPSIFSIPLSSYLHNAGRYARDLSNRGRSHRSELFSNFWR